MRQMQGEYPLLDADLTGLWLQPGFVEGVVAERKRFASLEAAFRHIFRRNLEYAVLLWNGLPVRFSYPEDLAPLASTVIAMLDAVQSAETTHRAAYELRTPNLEALWRVETEPEMVTIEGFWEWIAGDYQAALNQLGMVRMPRAAFLCEWKLLLEQWLRAIADAQAVLTGKEARSQLETLRRLEAGIPQRGRFYRYDDRDRPEIDKEVHHG